MLEEIELSEDGKAWLITVGFDSKTPRKSNPLAFEFGGVDRVYKRFSVDALHGNVISIKIRTV